MLASNAETPQVYKQGVFPIKHKEKYHGILPCVYRSAPEYSIMKWCDTNDKVIEWNSESIVIPYKKPTDGKYHRYFIDFSVLYKNSDGTTQKYLLEYKPLKFVKKPIKSKRMSQKTYAYLVETYAVNMAKWSAAKEYADKHDAKFIVISEDSIGMTQN